MNKVFFLFLCMTVVQVQAAEVSGTFMILRAKKILGMSQDNGQEQRFESKDALMKALTQEEQAIFNKQYTQACPVVLKNQHVAQSFTFNVNGKRIIFMSEIKIVQ